MAATDHPTHAPDVRILSAGTALPGPALDNAALAREFSMDALWEQWVDTFIGTGTRHLAVDLATGKLRESLADLATTAARRALGAAGLSPGDIDVIVLGTATPDQLMPATVNVVADRLGINEVPSYQLQSGCAGAVQALDVGRRLLASGEFRHALVLGGELCSRHYDPTRDMASLPPGELVNVVLFGDGAGAAVLTADPDAEGPVIRRVLNRLTGLGREPGQTVEWSGALDRGSDRPYVREDYKAIEESVPDMAVEIAKELLDDLGWTQADISYLLPPQLSERMTRRIVGLLGITGAEEVSCIRETANVGNATPFFQLERALPELADGDRVLGISVESSKWIKAGFALERV